MDDQTRQRLRAWSGVTVPTTMIKLREAIRVLNAVDLTVEGMDNLRREEEVEGLTQTGTPLGQELGSIRAALDDALCRLGHARAHLEGCSVMTDLDGNPV